MSIGICGCGCGGPVSINARRPRRYIAGHQQRKHVAPPSGYTVRAMGYTTPCWVWGLAHDRAGYGTTVRRGRKLFAHVAFWVERHGPVPPGLVLDHLCRVRDCCRPDHLEPVTPTENTRRSSATKLRPEQVRYIKTSKETTTALAVRFSVTPSNISHIRHGFSWKDVE